MPSLKFFNTLTRSLEEFKPIDPKAVGIYCCGPTVYNFQHIGNLKTYIFEDILVRTLRDTGYKVKHVMNITDVGHLTSDGDEGEDKMLLAMRREGKTSGQIADFYTDDFFVNCQKLNVIRPDIVCKATDHIQEMIDLIKRIEENGFAYVSNGNVYFDVMKFKEYGKLAKLDLSKLKAGSRIAVDESKRSPCDFVLWFTRSKFENHELLWDSPWGAGYPGWHIECSAMAIKYLGEKIDIHCGGIDHIPVHHTNEIAQSEAATGKPWVNLWMHSEFILINDQKMSKSTGGFLVLPDLANHDIDPMAYRLFCLSGHYRSQLNFSWDALSGAANSLAKLKSQVLALKAAVKEPNTNLPDNKYISAFKEAMYADLNTPRALAVVWELLSDAQITAPDKLSSLLHFDLILGLGIEHWKEKAIEVPDTVQKLLEQRTAARAAKQWQESDRLRDEIKSLGFLVEDSGGTQKLKPL